MTDRTETELVTTLREALTALAASDRASIRFGAAHHHYELAPPLTEAALAALEATLGAELPADLRMLACELGSGGAGPGHGWLPLARAAHHLVTAPAAAVPWTRALPVAHLGCGYAAVVPLDGAARGEVWIDARDAGRLGPAYPTFAAFYLDWVTRLAHGAWPEDPVPAGSCALASALSGYLGVCEQQLGLAAGTLAGPALREALGDLGPGAIEIAAEAGATLFTPGDRVEPCIACARLIDTLAAEGLRRDVVAPGALPLPLRPLR